MARARSEIVVVVLLTLLRPADARPPAPGPPGPAAASADPAVAVPRHLEAVSGILARARASDGTSRRALAEARISLTAARAAMADHALRAADELAASGDDLVVAADGPPDRGRYTDPARILARIDGFTAVLATVRITRVQALLTFARLVSDDARQKAARGDDDAGWEAARAEAIARAATHVAIATDPSLAPALPPPKPPGPPRDESS